MPEVTREQTLDALQNGWATYVDRFHALSPEAQAQFLKEQGYARFADLLGHVTAWWQEGEMVINGILKDPEYRWASYDVDAFNAQAVRRFSDIDEAVVVGSFELARISFRGAGFRPAGGSFCEQKNYRLAVRRCHRAPAGSRYHMNWNAGINRSTVGATFKCRTTTSRTGL